MKPGELGPRLEMLSAIRASVDYAARRLQQSKERGIRDEMDAQAQADRAEEAAERDSPAVAEVPPVRRDAEGDVRNAGRSEG